MSGGPLREFERMLRRRAGATLAGVAVLALALALFAAIVGVLQGFLFRSTIVHDIDRVVRVREHAGVGADQADLSLSAPVFDAWRRALPPAFEGIAAATTQAVTVQGSDGAGDSLPAALVTADFFSVLGVAPQLGRDFAAGEDASGDDGVVLLSDATWRARFGADPAVVGRTLRIDGRERTVIGVMPPHLRHPYGAALWLPLAFDTLLRQQGGNFLYVPARLRDGVDLVAAQAALGAVAANVHAAHPEFGPADGARLSPLREESVRDLRPTLWLLLASAAFVLLVAMLNVGAMFYAQNVADQRATAVRIALGAGRGALFRRALLRAGGVVGCAAALGLAAAGRLLQPLAGLSGNASIREFDSGARLDAPTLAWIALAALAVVVLLALLEVRQAFAPGAANGFGVRAASADRGVRRRLGFAAIVQCALSFALAAVATLVVLGYQRLLHHDRGFDAANLVVADLALPASRYATTPARDAVLARLLADVRALPGVQSAAAATVTPDYEGDWGAAFVIPGRPPLPDPGYEYTNHRLATPGYFATMRMPLIAGRDFDAANPARDAGAVIVSRSFAAHAWPQQDAVGQTLERLSGRQRPAESLHVIGVVADVDEAVRDPLAPPQRSWYLPTGAGTDYDYGQVSVVVRAAGDPVALAAALRSTLAHIDPELAWANLAPMSTRLEHTLAREHTSSFLYALFAVCAMLTAFGGLYGALAFLVESSRREFGIRQALGAGRRRIMAGILVRTGALAAVGIAIGALLAAVAGALARSVAAGATVHDAWAVLPLAALAFALALLIAAVPARRAANVDPMETLREE